MKKLTWKFAGTLVALSAIAACSEGLRLPTSPTGTASASGTSLQDGARTISGNAVITQMPGVVYRQIINARKAADGQVSGTLTVHLLDLSGFGEGDIKGTIVHNLTCLDFSADSVWFGADVSAASDKQFLDPQFTQTLGQIKSNNGVDYGFSGPALFYAPPGTKCTDRPALPITPVTEGHYTIR